jgi:uncharacterized protein YjbJ (UPF0337 family)
MTDDRIAGTAKNLGGKAQEAYGSMTGDRSQQAKGTVKQAEGAMQEMYGQAKEVAGDAVDMATRAAHDADDYVRRVIETRPYTVAFVALAAGFLLGRMGGRDYR